MYLGTNIHMYVVATFILLNSTSSMRFLDTFLNLKIDLLYVSSLTTSLNRGNYILLLVLQIIIKCQNQFFLKTLQRLQRPFDHIFTE